MKKKKNEHLFSVLCFIIGLIIGGTVMFFSLQDTKYVSSIKITDSFDTNSDWDVIYLMEESSPFNITSSKPKSTIEGRLVYPNYILIKIKGKTIIDVTETFQHEMAHLYIHLDRNHFVYKNASSVWNEYTDIIGNSPPSIIFY